MEYFKPERVDSDFEKKFSFQRERTWLLPSINVVHKDDLWHVESFTRMKDELNNSKSYLNDKGEEWNSHTSSINPSNLIIDSIRRVNQPEIVSQAWCKFYEVLSNYPIVSKEAECFNSFHICEAPGSFISALNYYICNEITPDLEWTWLANTLNPYYEGQDVKHVVVDDRLLFPTWANWYFGKDGTGDITDPQYLKDLRTFLEERTNPHQRTFNLITADGSLNCLDNPGEQELIVSELQFSEVLIGLYTLAPGASFIIKKFTFFECITICTMYLLNCIFKKVHVFKPCTSKSGNSEVYVICLDFQGAENLNDYLDLLSQANVSKSGKAIFPLSSIPESFISQLYTCSKKFMRLQQSAILKNMVLFIQKDKSSYSQELSEVQKLYRLKYNIICNTRTPNPCYKEYYLFSPKKQILTTFHGYKQNCKKLYFQAIGETFDNLSKSSEMSWPEIVQDVERRLNKCFPLQRKRQQDEGLDWTPVESWIRRRIKSGRQRHQIGKKIDVIQNSKFCNPMLLHLWNRLAHHNEIQESRKKFLAWNILDLLALLKKNIELECFYLVFISSPNTIEEKDPVLFQMKRATKESFKILSSKLEATESDIPDSHRILYINPANWVKSVHAENIVKYDLALTLSSVVKFLTEGDILMISFPSLLTRYTVGLLFMLLSMFEKFVYLLPDDKISPYRGQLWVLYNYQKPKFYAKVSDYMKRISHCEDRETKDVLEVVHIASLCGGHFYELLLTMNNKHMMERLRGLISIEKQHQVQERQNSNTT